MGARKETTGAAKAQEEEVHTPARKRPAMASPSRAGTSAQGAARRSLPTSPSTSHSRKRVDTKNTPARPLNREQKELAPVQDFSEKSQPAISSPPRPREKSNSQAS